MATLHGEWIVIIRAAKWWVTMDGQRTGPYLSEEAAVHAAIVEAKNYERAGHTARVSIDGPDDLPTVYETSRQ